MPDRYAYRVIWSEEDGEYVGLCAEFPSVSHLDKTPEKALSGIRKLVGRIAADMRKHGETVPEPIGIRRYSGRFVVRVPPAVHRRLSLEAAETGVSLNSCVTAHLAG